MSDLADRLLTLSTEFAEKGQDHLDKGERYMTMSNMVWERAEVIMARDTHPDPDDPNDERNYDDSEYDEHMMPLRDPHAGDWEEMEDQDD